MPANENTLIEAGVRVGLVAAESLPRLRLEAKRERLGLVEALTRAGRFPEVALYRALAEVRGLPFLPPADLVADQEVLTAVPRRVWQTRLMLPVRARDGGRLLVLTDPDDRLSIERVERGCGRELRPALADPASLRKAVAEVWRDARELQAFEPGTAVAAGARPEPSPGAPPEASGPADPVRLLDDLMKEAYLRRASDIHLEPQENGLRIRLRVDGQLQEYPVVLAKADEEALVNRVKVLAGLDIAEQRMAQDGAMKYAIAGWSTPETDLRVATIPTRWGERCTLRILGQETGRLSLGDLGMGAPMLARFRHAVGRPHGMILVTGPTGSGKSTTLYAAIRELPLGGLNVLTVEDPVEQTLPGITQVQASGKVGFADALRSFLRHDPDVILVGEIRDRETAEIGLRAAMTGHLVLSTLHTNDAVGAVTRLADIGAERFLIGSTLLGVVAQRLARRLCPHCRRRRACTPEERRLLGLPPEGPAELHEPQGCSFCLGTGYRGRIGLFETLWIDRTLRTAIAEGAGEREIRRLAPEFTSLWQDCREKVLAGAVALPEVLHHRMEEGG